jgi:predicted GIY-YIG superfamily endonuclease
MKSEQVFTKEHQDVHVVMHWRQLDILNPPSCAGVYAIADANMNKWLYIGKSQNIAKRIAAKNHPVQVTKDVCIGQSYFYLRVAANDISWFEQYAIKRLDPEWNGGTSFGSASQTPWAYCNISSVHGLTDPMTLAVLAAIGS